MEVNVLPDKEKINIEHLIVPRYEVPVLGTMHLPFRSAYAAYPKNHHEVRAVLRWAKERGLPVRYFGGMSNTIVPTKGLDGVALFTTHLTRCHVSGELFCVRAGLALEKAIGLAIDAGLGGLEPLAGIPGTVGGAVWGNAGASGVDTGKRLGYVDWIDPSGDFHRWQVHAGDFSYRHSPFQSMPGALIYEAGFRLEPDRQTSAIRLVMEEIRHERIRKGQWERPSCGCMFLNPPGDHAGRLIDQAGLGGMRRGGAVVSPHHAAFIVNAGSASAEDVRGLALDIKSAVLERTGVDLALEVNFPGDWS